MKKIRLLIWLPLLIACGSQPTKSANSAARDSARAQMEEAMKAMQKADYSAATDIFDKMLVQKPASEFDLVVLYNDGVAYESLGDCKKAASLYRQATSGAVALKIARVEAESIYRLSYAYECLGDDRRTIAALLDAKRRSRNLSPDIAGAELPARLAVAYARIGQRMKAIQYFKSAGNGLKQALSQAGTTSHTQQQFAARMLYAMGHLSPVQKGLNSDPKAFLMALSVQQPYLLQSAEFNLQPDSRSAADDLIFAYENLLKLKPAASDQGRAFLLLALQDIAEIKKIRLPDKGPLVDQIYDRIEVQESRIRQMLASTSDMTPLTKEAKSREGLKRQGRVKSQ